MQTVGPDMYMYVHKLRVKITWHLICFILLTHAKCGTRSTLCWKVGNISGSTELFAL